MQKADKKASAASQDYLSPQSIWKVQLRNRPGQKIPRLDGCISILCPDPTTQRLAIVMINDT